MAEPIEVLPTVLKRPCLVACQNLAANQLAPEGIASLVESGTGHPERGLDVPKASGAFFQVGLDREGGYARAKPNFLTLGLFLEKKIGELKGLGELAVEPAEQRAVARDQAGIEERSLGLVIQPSPSEVGEVTVSVSDLDLCAGEQDVHHEPKGFS